MILSTQTDVIFRVFGEEEGIRLFAEAGFDAIDYSMFPMSADDCHLNTGDVVAHAKHLRSVADSYGIKFNQAHAPFPCWRAGDEAYNAKMPDRIVRAVMIAGTLGANSVVVHPIAYPGGGEPQKEFNINYYRTLEPIALEYGTKIALENMWGHDNRRGYIVPNVCSFGADLADYYDTLGNPDAFTVCLDLGHCGLVGEEPDDAIRALGGKRLGALHVHDNDYKHDSHVIPYTFGCTMNWDKITKALGEIDYQGEFTYEADNFLARIDRAALPAALSYMEKLGRVLIGKIDAARPNKA